MIGDFGLSTISHKSIFTDSSFIENRKIKYAGLSLGLRSVCQLSISKSLSLILSGNFEMDGSRSEDTEVHDSKNESIHYAMTTGKIQGPAYFSFGIGISYCIWNRFSREDRINLKERKRKQKHYKS